MSEIQGMSASLEDRERRQLRRKARTATLAALRELGGEADRDDVHDLALAHGGFTPRELSAPAPEAVAAKFDRAVDHQLSWALAKLRREGLVEHRCRAVWRLVVAAPATDARTPDGRSTSLAAPQRQTAGPRTGASGRSAGPSLVRRLLAF